MISALRFLILLYKLPFAAGGGFLLSAAGTGHGRGRYSALLRGFPYPGEFLSGRLIAHRFLRMAATHALFCLFTFRDASLGIPDFFPGLFGVMPAMFTQSSVPAVISLFRVGTVKPVYQRRFNPLG